MRMGTVTDPTADAGEREERAGGPVDLSHLHAGDENPNHPRGSNGVNHLPSENSSGFLADGELGSAPADANPNHPRGRNGVNHLPSESSNPGFLADGELGAAPAGAKPAIEFSPAPPHRGHSGGTGLFSYLSGGVHRGASGSVAVPRGGSGGFGGVYRHGSGSVGGIHRHGSGSVGGIHRHGSGSAGPHRSRSGVHLPSLASITFAMSRLPEEDAGLQMHFTETKEEEPLPESPMATDDGATPRKKNRMRKHLTAVGACSFGFRLSECVLSLISIIVMCANSQYMGTEFGTLKFNHFQAYKYLVSVNVFVFVYSTLQFIQLAYTVILGMSFIPSIFLSTWLTFGFDQLLSYLLLSASSSAATVANMSYTGEMGVRFCSRYDLGSFCARADAAVTMSFFTFMAMLSSTILAIHRIAVLLREY